MSVLLTEESEIRKKESKQEGKKLASIYTSMTVQAQPAQRLPGWSFPGRTPIKGTGKAVPLQAWSGPEGSRKLRFLDFMTTAQGGGKVVCLTHRPPLALVNTPGTHFC